MSADRIPKFQNQVEAGKDNQKEVTSALSEIPPVDYSIPAFLVTVLFNHVLGFFAYHFTVSARHSWQLKNYKKSKKHARYVKILLLLGLIAGIASYSVALSLYFTISSDDTCTSYDGMRNVKNDLPTAMSEPLTNCCKYCAPMDDEKEQPVDRILTEDPKCEVFCRINSTGLVNVNLDLNEDYSDCCMEFTCTVRA